MCIYEVRTLSCDASSILPPLCRSPLRRASRKRRAVQMYCGVGDMEVLRGHPASQGLLLVGPIHGAVLPINPNPLSPSACGPSTRASVYHRRSRWSTPPEPVIGECILGCLRLHFQAADVAPASCCARVCRLPRSGKQLADRLQIGSCSAGNGTRGSSQAGKRTSQARRGLQ